jgi:hypothetical protein
VRIESWIEVRIEVRIATKGQYDRPAVATVKARLVSRRR